MRGDRQRDPFLEAADRSQGGTRKSQGPTPIAGYMHGFFCIISGSPRVLILQFPTLHPGRFRIRQTPYSEGCAPPSLAHLGTKWPVCQGCDEVLHKHFAAPQWLLEEMWKTNRAAMAGGEAQDLPAGFPSSQSSQTCLLSNHQLFPFDQ